MVTVGLEWGKKSILIYVHISTNLLHGLFKKILFWTKNLGQKGDSIHAEVIGVHCQGPLYILKYIVMDACKVHEQFI